jgi:hypothetical protein
MTLAEQFEALALTDLNSYLATGQEENLSLDFKTINRAELTHNDDKKNLAKALSGFSNSSGGLLVWGIIARKNADGVDCAFGTQEVDSLPLFISRLNELTGSAVSPIAEGVRHKAIPPAADRGFAVTLVPESDSGPHMAKLGEDRYYKRSGDSFYRMEHFDLEDMFGRRKKPKLNLTTRIAGGSASTTIILGIENTGRGTAKAPYLAFDGTAPFAPRMFGLDGNGNDGLPKLHFGQRLKYRYGASGNVVIHPGTIHEVAALDLGWGARVDNIPNQDVIIEYEISAEDSQIVRSAVNLGRIAIE